MSRKSEWYKKNIEPGLKLSEAERRKAACKKRLLVVPVSKTLTKQGTSNTFFRERHNTPSSVASSAEDIYVPKEVYRRS